MPLLESYKNTCRELHYHEDTAQLSVLHRLVWFGKKLKILCLLPRWLRHQLPVVKGVYLWGEPGSGKTFLLDLFITHLAKKNLRVLRLHQHDFNLEVRQYLNRLSVARVSNPVSVLVKDWAKCHDLIFLDDIHLTDAAGVVFFSQVVHEAFRQGLFWLISANRPPEQLYQKGPNRNAFLKTIAFLDKHLLVCTIQTNDYRLQHPVLRHFYCGNHAQAEVHLSHIYKAMTGQGLHTETLLVHGRPIPVLGQYQDILCIDFKILITPPRAIADFIDIASKYQTIIIHRLTPILQDQNNLAISWIRCMDILYSRDIKLYIIAHCPLDAIYPKGTYHIIYKRTHSRLMEMLA